MCRWNRQVRIILKLRWAADMVVLEVITNLVMCSGRNFDTGEGSIISSMCRWTRQVRIRLKMRWAADMVGRLTKCYVPHNV
jgi:hypothetical protein